MSILPFDEHIVIIMFQREYFKSFQVQQKHMTRVIEHVPRLSNEAFAKTTPQQDCRRADYLFDKKVYVCQPPCTAEESTERGAGTMYSIKVGHRWDDAVLVDVTSAIPSSNHANDPHALIYDRLLTIHASDYRLSHAHMALSAGHACHHHHAYLSMGPNYRVDMINNRTLRKDIENLTLAIATYPFTSNANSTPMPITSNLYVGYRIEPRLDIVDAFGIYPGIPYCTKHAEIVMPRKGVRNVTAMKKEQLVKSVVRDRNKRKARGGEAVIMPCGLLGGDDTSDSEDQKVKYSSQSSRSSDADDSTINPIPPAKRRIRDDPANDIAHHAMEIVTRDLDTVCPSLNTPATVKEFDKSTKRSLGIDVSVHEATCLMFPSHAISEPVHPQSKPRLRLIVKRRDHASNYVGQRAVMRPNATMIKETLQLIDANNEYVNPSLAQFYKHGAFKDVFFTMPRMQRILPPHIADVILNAYTEFPCSGRVVIDCRLLEHCDLNHVLTVCLPEQIRKRQEAIVLATDVLIKPVFLYQQFLYRFHGGACEDPHFASANMKIPKLPRLIVMHKQADYIPVDITAEVVLAFKQALDVIFFKFENS